MSDAQKKLDLSARRATVSAGEWLDSARLHKGRGYDLEATQDMLEAQRLAGRAGMALDILRADYGEDVEERAQALAEVEKAISAFASER